MNEETFLNRTSESVSDFLQKDEFWLYDLRVEVVQGDKPFICKHKVGAYFVVEGENLIFKEGQNFPMYWNTAPILPLGRRGRAAHLVDVFHDVRFVADHAHRWLTHLVVVLFHGPRRGRS